MTRVLMLAVLGSLTVPRPGAQAQDKPTAPASEKNPSIPAAGHSLHGEAFDEGPRQKAYLKDGQGKVEFPISTAKPDAQAFMNQGVAQLHSFYYLEAERSFRQAAQIDSANPMPYWGMAMANVNNANRARGFVKEALKKAEKAKVSPREKLYLDAMAALYKDNGVHAPEFLAGMESLVQEFPDDLDARVWLAMLIWQNGNVGASRQSVDGLLQYVERIEPLHPGVHHYRIHLWDGVKPIRAEKSAGLFAKSAPGIAHAWHMPGHTYTSLLRYADAAYQQEGSARVDHAAMLRDRIMPFEIHNYAHNNQWLATSLSHVGRARDAIAVARDLTTQARDPQKNNKSDGGSAQRSGRARWSEILVPLRAVGRPDRGNGIGRRSIGPTFPRRLARKPIAWAWPMPPGGTRASSASKSRRSSSSTPRGQRVFPAPGRDHRPTSPPPPRPYRPRLQPSWPSWKGMRSS